MHLSTFGKEKEMQNVWRVADWDIWLETVVTQQGNDNGTPVKGNSISISSGPPLQGGGEG